MRDIAVVVSNSDRSMISPFETIDAIKEAGFQHVFIQWYNNSTWKQSQEEQLKYIRRLDLNVLFAHLEYKKINSIWEDDEYGETLVENYIRDIKLCKDNGIPMIVMHVTNGSKSPSVSESGLNRFKKICDYARELDIKVAFENTEIKGYLEYVIEHITNDNVGICFDSGHCHLHFNNEFNFDLFKDRILAVHFHDNDQTDDMHMLPFDGTIDWSWFVSRLKECNYVDPITLEILYLHEYLQHSPLDFYRRGYMIGEKLAREFEK